MATKFDGEVLYVSPEEIIARRQAELIESQKGGEIDAEEVLDGLREIQRSATGEYREVKGYEVAEGVQGPVLGRVLVYIDEAPDDPQDGSGHYETYTKTDHGEPYHPTPSRRGLTGEVVSK